MARFNVTKLHDDSTAGTVIVTATYQDAQGNEQTANSNAANIIVMAEKIKKYWADGKSPTVDCEVSDTVLTNLGYAFTPPGS